MKDDAPSPPLRVPHMTILIIAGWAIVVSLSIWVLSFAQVVLIPLVGAIVLHLTMMPAVRWFHRHLPVRRGVSTFLFILSMLVLSSSAVLIFSPAITTWLAGLAEAVSSPKRWEDIISPAIAERLSETLGRILGPLVVNTTSGVVTVCITLVITFFLLVSGEGPMQRITLMARTFRQRRQIVRIFRDLERNTARYVLTLSLINFCEFLAVALALVVLGLPKPWAMGLIAGLFNFVPYIGPILAAALIFASTTVDSGQIGTGLLGAGVFLVINLIEGYIVSPMVYGSRLRINPIAIIFAVLMGSWLWGVAGALLAMPLLVMLRVACDRATCLGPLGLLLTDRPMGYGRRWSRKRSRARRFLRRNERASRQRTRRAPTVDDLDAAVAEAGPEAAAVLESAAHEPINPAASSA